MRRILVVAAHPDDEVLGCGGTMARATAAGDVVRVLIVATGAASRAHPNEAALAAALRRLRSEAQAANQHLGVAPDHVVFGGFVDQQLDVVPRLDIVKFIRSEVQTWRPDVVYTHHGGDYNPDHRAVFDATLAGTRPYLGEHHPSAVYAFETLSSTEWGWGNGSDFRPTAYVDISAHLDAKKAALAAYASEIREFPHPRSIEGIDALARKRGSEVSRPAAEAFETIRVIDG